MLHNLIHHFIALVNTYDLQQYMVRMGGATKEPLKGEGKWRKYVEEANPCLRVA